MSVLQDVPNGTPGSFSYNERTVASAVLVWDVGTGALRAQLRRDAPEEAARSSSKARQGFSSMGTPFFLPDGTLLTTGQGLIPPCLWDVQTGTLKRPLPMREKPPERPYLSPSVAAVSPDGRLLAVGGNVNLWAAKDRIKRRVGRIFVYDMESGKILRTLGDEIPDTPVPTERSQNVWDFPAGPEDSEMGDQLKSLAFSPDGRFLATGGERCTPESDNQGSMHFVAEGGLVRLWNVENGALKATLPSHQASITALAFSDDGKRLAGADSDNLVSVWSLGTAREEHTWAARGRWVETKTSETTPGPGGKRTEHTTTYTLSANGSKNSSSSNTKALDDPRAAGEIVTTTVVRRQTERGVSRLNFSPDGARLRALNFSRSVVEWDLEKPTPDEAPIKYLPTGTGARMAAFAFSPDGKLAVSADHDGKVRIWNMETRQQILAWPAHKEAALAVAWTPDGGSLVTSGPVRKWTWVEQGDGHKTGTAATLGTEIRVWNRATGALRRSWTLDGEDVQALALSLDGATLYTAGNTTALAQPGAGSALRWWNLQAALDNGVGDVGRTAPLAPFHTEIVGGARVVSLALSRDGSTLATDHESAGLRLWQARGGELKASLDLPAPLAPGTMPQMFIGRPFETGSLAFAPNGHLLRAKQQEIQIWNGESGELLDSVSMAAAARCVALSPDGHSFVVSAFGQEGGPQMWDAASLQPLPWPGSRLNGQDLGSIAESLTFSPDGKTVAAYAGGPIYLWSSVPH